MNTEVQKEGLLAEQYLVALKQRGSSQSGTRHAYKITFVHMNFPSIEILHINSPRKKVTGN